MATEQGQCVLCKRAPLNLTKHHLIPRALHHNKRIRRVYNKQKLEQHVIWICRPCHNHIHNALSEKDLAYHYNTLQALQQHTVIATFCRWLSSKPPGFKPRNR